MKKLILATLALLAIAAPAQALTWTLKDYWPNLTVNGSCALTNDTTNGNSRPWYAVTESLSTCPGGPAGSTCWRRGNNADRGQAPSTWPTPYSYDHGWDYDLWNNSDGKAYYYGLIVYRKASGCGNLDNCGGIDVYQVDNPLTTGTNYMPASVDDANSNPLWTSTYASSSTTYYKYDASWNLLDTKSVPGGYTKIDINKVQDGVVGGTPFYHIEVTAWASPANNPYVWSEAEKISLSHIITSDTTNCGGATASARGMSVWSIAGHTLLFGTDMSQGWQYHP